MELNEHIINLTKILKTVGERVEGNLICDISPDNWTYMQNMDKIKNLQNLCKGKKKIVEIGVNACHSLILMLLENPEAEYLLFDLNFHRYTEPALDYVKRAFPNTVIKIVYGNSVETITQYINDNPEELHTYDMCHLDGGHTEDIFSVDYENMKQFNKKNSCVIFDDYDLPQIRNFIHKKIENGEIKELCNNVIKTNRHFIYEYC